MESHGKWTITVEGGPAYWENVRAALGIATEDAFDRGPAFYDVLKRLQWATAVYRAAEHP